jgi:hypothetical protein
MLGYEMYSGKKRPKSVRLFYDRIKIGNCIAEAERKGAWDGQRKIENVIQVDEDLENQPYRVPKLTADEVKRSRVFGDVGNFSSENARYYVLPVSCLK